VPRKSWGTAGAHSFRRLIIVMDWPAQLSSRQVRLS
jgi:hypothetical protein